MGPIQSFQELRDFLLRRANVIVLGVAIGLLLGLFLALRSGAVYQAVAVLSTRVEAVSDQAVGSSSAGTPARLMQLVEQRLTLRENMLRLADEYDLFPGLPTETRVQLVRNSITLLSESAVTIGFGSDGSLASMIIMARADGGQKAADIANELAQMVIRETGEGRVARARETLQFLQVEQTQLTGELQALEAESREFTNQNFDVLSFSADVRRTELAQIVGDIQEARRDITAAESELSTLQTQNVSQRRQSQLRDQINIRQTELERLLAQQAEFEPYFRRVAEAEREMDNLNDRKDRLRDRLREISQQVAQAEGSLRLEANERSASFELVEPATAPDYPISRSRRVTLMMGVVAGAVLGLFAAFAYELFRPALRSAGQVERELGMRPVLLLPELTSPSQKRRTLLGWFAGACLMALALAALLLAQQGM